MTEIVRNLIVKKCYKSSLHKDFYSTVKYKEIELKMIITSGEATHGTSGLLYPFRFYTLSEALPEKGVVDIFTKVEAGYYDVLYRTDR